MRLLVTGPTGFIGSAFIRLALARGHHVAGLIIPTEPIPARLPPTETLTWLRGTLEDPPWRDIADFQPEVCLHMAWITTPGVYLESPDNYRFLETSLTFLRQLVDLGVQHIVTLGTCIEYQITNQPLSEDTTPIAPTTTYARCKNDLRLALESLRIRGHSSASPVVPLSRGPVVPSPRSPVVPWSRGPVVLSWSRIFYPYGPGEHPSRLCSSLISKLRRGEEIVLKTPDSTKDYIYIDDLAEALLTIVEKRFHGAINVGTGQGTTVRQIADYLAQSLGRPDLIRLAPNPEPDPFPFVVADASRLKSLGWRPAHDLRQGLRELLASTAP
jgi:nucleoside-diphosphate-sugar epimerase